MNTLPAFDREPYLRELAATVLAIGTDERGPYAVLSDTILYPEGGGQPADHGMIGLSAVVDVQKRESEIRHYLAEAIPVGAAQVVLDWARRFDHMQQHTGQHLLTAVAHTRFGWPTTAFHLGDTRCDVELETPSISTTELALLEYAIAEEIHAARVVRARQVSPEDYAALAVRSRGLPEGHSGAIRLVEIEGLDLNTCGGTHVRSTAELEVVKLLGTESIRGGIRLFFVVGGRARARMSEHERRNAALRALLGAPDEELVVALEAKLDQLKAAERRGRALEEEFATAVIDRLALGSDRILAHHFEDKDANFVQKAARQLASRVPSQVVFLTGTRDGVSCFVLTAGEASGFDVATAGKELASILDAKGGGAKGFFQGKTSTLAKLDQALGWLRG
ncbi:MAG: DHHA1 domain-containing protein [Holophaga sp.]